MGAVLPNFAPPVVTQPHLFAQSLVSQGCDQPEMARLESVFEEAGLDDLALIIEMIRTNTIVKPTDLAVLQRWIEHLAIRNQTLIAKALAAAQLRNHTPVRFAPFDPQALTTIFHPPSTQPRVTETVNGGAIREKQNKQAWAMAGVEQSTPDVSLKMQKALQLFGPNSEGALIAPARLPKPSHGYFVPRLIQLFLDLERMGARLEYQIVTKDNEGKNISGQIRAIWQFPHSRLLIYAPTRFNFSSRGGDSQFFLTQQEGLSGERLYFKVEIVSAENPASELPRLLAPFFAEESLIRIEAKSHAGRKYLLLLVREPQESAQELPGIVNIFGRFLGLQ